MERQGMWGTIDATPIVFPLVVQRMDSIRADLAAPLAAVEALVPDALRVEEVAPGQAFVSVIVTHYVQADWGSFTRASVVTPVRPRAGTPGIEGHEMGLYTCVGATSARFLNEVLYWVLGLHHVDCTVDVAYGGRGDDDVCVDFRADGAPVVRVAAPLVAPPAVSIMTSGNLAYSVLEGRVLRACYDVSTGAGPVDAAAVELTLGPGPLGDALATLGFSAADASWYSGRAMRMVLHEPDLGPPTG